MAKKSGKRAMGTSLETILTQKNILSVSETRTSGGMEKEIQELKKNNQTLENKIAALTDELEAQKIERARTIEGLFSQAVLHLKKDNPLDAMGMLQAVCALDKDHVKARLNMAVVYAGLNHTERAVAVLNEILELEPDNPIARRNLNILLGE